MRIAVERRRPRRSGPSWSRSSPRARTRPRSRRPRTSSPRSRSAEPFALEIAATGRAALVPRPRRRRRRCAPPRGPARRRLPPGRAAPLDLDALPGARPGPPGAPTSRSRPARSACARRPTCRCAPSPTREVAAERAAQADPVLGVLGALGDLPDGLAGAQPARPAPGAATTGAAPTCAWRSSTRSRRERRRRRRRHRRWPSVWLPARPAGRRPRWPARPTSGTSTGLARAWRCSGVGAAAGAGRRCLARPAASAAGELYDPRLVQEKIEPARLPGPAAPGRLRAGRRRPRDAVAAG